MLEKGTCTSYSYGAMDGKPGELKSCSTKTNITTTHTCTHIYEDFEVLEFGFIWGIVE